MVVFDANMLIAVLEPDKKPPLNSATGLSVDNFRERLDYLMSRLTENGMKIIIPAPALSEFLVRADQAAQNYLSKLQSSSVFQIAPFDERCAVEVAAMTREAINSGDKRGGVEGPYAKIKYDRQIVAVARVAGALEIYSDDKGVAAFGEQAGLSVISMADLPPPPAGSQINLALDSSSSD